MKRPHYAEDVQPVESNLKALQVKWFLLSCQMKVILFMMLLPAHSVRAQWEQLGPANNFEVTGIACGDSFLLASATCGLHYSINNGISWTALSSIPFMKSVRFKDTLCLSSGYQVYRNGSGAIIQNQLLGFPGTSDLVTYGGVIYAESQWSGFLYSYDARLWIAQNSGLPKVWDGMQYLYAIASLGVNDKYLFAGTNDGIYRKEKTSSQWAGSGLTGCDVRHIWCEDSTMLAACGYSQVFRSIDNGNSWQLKLTVSGGIVNDIEKIGDTIYIATKWQGLYFSTDDGNNWNAMSPGTIKNINSIATCNGISYMGTDSGIFMNTQQPQRINGNISCATITELAQSDNCLVALQYERAEISSDTGKTWTDVTSQLNLNSFSSAIGFHKEVLITGKNYSSCPVYKTSDNGNSWMAISSLPYNGDGWYFSTNGKLILATTDQFIYKSVDSGATWTNVSVPSSLIVCEEVTGVAFSGTNIFVTECGVGELLKSSDSGLSWQISNSGVQNAALESIAEANGILFCWDHYNLYRSMDDGTTWTQSGSTLPFLPDDLYTMLGDGVNIYAYVIGGVFFSNDGGVGWNCITGNYPVPNPSCHRHSMLVRDNRLYLANNDFGVWRRSTDVLPIAVFAPEFDHRVSLFPNPANESVQIRLRIPNGSSSLFQLVIENLWGQKIYQETFPKQNGGMLESITLSEKFTCGLYLVIISSEEGRWVSPLIVEK